MTTSSLRRQMKNIVNNYTDAEIKVREATSNDPWGPPSSLLMEIADLTFNVVAFTEVMGIIWKRLNDHGKNWRHVYKALTLLDYLIKSGSERVAQQCKENIYAIQTLRDFQYIDRDGQDQGMSVREKSKQLVALLRDDEKLKQERSQALKTRERVAGSGGYGSLPPPYPGRPTSQPSMEALYGEEQSRPRGSPSSFNYQLVCHDARYFGKVQKFPILCFRGHFMKSVLIGTVYRPAPVVDIDEQTQLQIAMSLSKEETHKPAPPPPPPPAAAVALDMDEEAQLQLALSLSKEEHQQSAMLDLADIFAPAPDVPSVAKPWDSSAGHSALAQAGPLRSDPWDSLDDDLFDEAMDGGQANVNGHGTPEPFDMSSFGEGLPKTAHLTCSTPEAFLGPTGASLVNLDSLIPSNPPSKNFNPFLSGLSAPSASNPFQHEPQPRLTLNQMRPSSTSPLPTSLPFNASLPMAASNQPSSLPSTFTQSAQVPPLIPGHLPQPLLPLSTASTLGDPDQHNQNPFL
ncbi:Epsin-3 [Anabarilius grahami]|uniref:Epsin-3 n=1 Tax=Anabarilius grahami TaxID=495550 RepID=A0A3N0Z464_ANAGA|nr:Epsin-3 [Anabarilius grahami]